MSKTLLLSGCNGNTAKEVTRVFKEKGWKIIGIDIDDCVNSDIDEFVKCDIRDAQAVKELVEHIEKNNAIDGMFNTAGYTIDKDFLDVSAEEWDALLDTVLGGSSNLCKAVAPYMKDRKEGRILLLSPDYAKDKGENVHNAAASCTLHGFSKSFGVEMAPYNVLVNAMFANTPFDLEVVAETAYYLIAENTYTTAQVVAVANEQYL